MNRALLYCAGGGIGDSLIATVVAQALRGRYDSVDALTLPGHRSTLELVPEIDRTDASNWIRTARYSPAAKELLNKRNRFELQGNNVAILTNDRTCDLGKAFVALKARKRERSTR